MPNHSTHEEPQLRSIPVAVSVPRLGQFDFRVHSRPDQYISGSLIRDGIWEPFETEVFCRLCRESDIVADLGANIGWYSVIASRIVGTSGRVISFEPDPTNLDLLRENVVLSGHSELVEIHNLAVADREADAELFLCETNLGDHRIFSDGSTRDSLVVRVSTLDAVFADCFYPPTLVKSDTQGSEARILRGASAMLGAGWRPIFILEYWPFGLTHSGDDPLRLFHRLVSLDYEIFELTEENPRLIALMEDRVRARLLTDLVPQSMAFINLLCLPRASERRTLIGDLVSGA
jgi:FkbM family methyltransferase